MAHTYAVLEIDPKSFEDIKKRLKAVDRWETYAESSRDYPELIVFGPVGLAPEKSNPPGYAPSTTTGSAD